MLRKLVLSTIAMCFSMVVAAPVSASLINLIVRGTVSSNALTNSTSPYLGVPVGAAVTYTMPINTTSIAFAVPDEILYNVQKGSFVLAVAGTPTVNGVSGLSTFQYDDGGSGFYNLQPPSIAIAGGPQTSVSFRANGTAGPNPFVNTSPADIEASHGTYVPTPAVFHQTLDFNIQVLNASFQFQKVQIAIDSFTITPEPTSLSLLVVGGLMTIIRRRRA